uniref:Uncharacterized protein n=1 Tax=Nelumbo nucifera TaxID=4432 RepID=A0A822XPJ9_NELNU|nr:TPA_asm: hypothetical protein HUJ06_022462 [Nelumbo nucifera]
MPLQLYCVFLVKGEVHIIKPPLQLIIPSATYGGAVISFVLCPSELVKGSELLCM